MLSFSQKINLKYDVGTYKGVRDNYNWIIRSAQQMTDEALDITSSFLFYLGKTYCSASSLDEFIEQCYGIDGFRLVSFSVFVRKKNGDYIFGAYYLGDLSIDANSRQNLEQIMTILNDNLSKEETAQKNMGYTIKNEYHNVGIVVSGDNNTVSNNTSTVSETEKSINDNCQKESTIKKWIEAIAQNLTASLIWYLIPIIGLAIYIISRSSF